MGLFTTEHLHASYPHLPTRVLKAAVSAHVGPLTCANVAQEMGAIPLLRWHRQVGRIYALCETRIDLQVVSPRHQHLLLFFIPTR